MVICLERGADLHMAQLMTLPLTVSCFSKIQIGFTFLVPAHPGSPGKKAVKWVCVCAFDSTVHRDVATFTSQPRLSSTRRSRCQLCTFTHRQRRVQLPPSLLAVLIALIS